MRCQQGKDSVPRNRVYTHYAQRCGSDRVDTLNPASFGKLVRIIFPGIQTRRLGQRGESKYHYVNLILLDEQQAENGAQPNGGHGFGPLQAGSNEDYDYRSATCKRSTRPNLRYKLLYIPNILTVVDPDQVATLQTALLFLLTRP